MRPTRAVHVGSGVCEEMVKRILVSVVLAPLFFAVLFFPPTICLAVVVSAIAAMASYELLRATRVAHHNRMYVYTALSAAAIPMGYWFGWGRVVSQGAALFLMAALFLIAIRLYDREKAVGFEQVMVCLFGGLMIPMSLSALVQLREMEHGQYLVLLPVICAFLTDAGAYFAGVFLGRHRGITRVSPNKSLEGYIGGILSGGVFMLLYGLLLEHFAQLEVSFPVLALYGLAGSAITELGDLSFSLVKRQYGVKDYGTLLPGHGGMLDRFDSMTFAAPMLLLLVELIPAF